MPNELFAIPGIRKTVLVPATNLSPKNCEGTAITLKNGHILYLWQQFYNVELLPESERPSETGRRRAPTTDDGYARIMGMTSSDGGYTWSNPWVVVDDQDALVNCVSPAITRMADERLLLAYSWRSGGNHSDNFGECARMVRISEDAGKTWSDRTRITPEDGRYHTGCHGRAWTLPKGRVLIHCHTFVEGVKSKLGLGTYIAYSDDNGSSWKHSNLLVAPIGGNCHEGCIAQRKNGSLLMVMRSNPHVGQSMISESKDDGATWSEPRPSGVVSANAPTYISGLPNSNAILMVWNSNFIPVYSKKEFKASRCPLMCAVSHDEGCIWGLPRALEIDVSCEWAYPIVHFHDDMALVFYHRSPMSGGREVILTHIPIDWFQETPLALRS